MKKLLFIAAFSLVGVTAFAQDKNDMDGEKTTQVAKSQQGYMEVTLDELPGEVVMGLEKKYPEANIDKAYWNSEDLKFKLDITKQDGTSESLYVNKEGKFLDVK
ncbi:hypothetical protein [Robiginitalea sp. SC105]|uniref:hypothetical protein n=1 Tax=Robiginitalea sp. SC105 TaxID=2762332 RepID=UPI00163AAFEB|nr:hypothetical protein [Robiginitalea sp. SC105]MBC2840268.1 hypothetical protein [Robiginitalea sp. SC105]